MKIAMMMRAVDQDSGHQPIIEGLVEHMARANPNVEFLLLYRTKKRIDRFSGFANAQCLLVSAPNKLLWDQIAVPYAAWRHDADVIFNPKFSVPLMTSCPVVMGLHEPAWWAWPEHYEWLDRNYMRTMLPLYIRKARRLFPISEFVVTENKKYLRLPVEKTTVFYPAPKPYFQRITDPARLQAAREKWGLPSRFVLAVTRVDHVGMDKPTTFFPGKNVETTVRAYNLIRDKIPQKLVVAGRQVREYLLELDFTPEEIEGIKLLGYVPHDELPEILSLADTFVLPSFYESYAMALVEAMTCGCPIVCSQTGACPEITAGAALFADPNDPSDFADKIERVLRDDVLKDGLRNKSLERAAFFDWKKSASVVMNAIEKVVER